MKVELTKQQVLEYTNLIVVADNTARKTTRQLMAALKDAGSTGSLAMAYRARLHAWQLWPSSTTSAKKPANSKAARALALGDYSKGIGSYVLVFERIEALERADKREEEARAKAEMERLAALERAAAGGDEAPDNEAPAAPKSMRLTLEMARACLATPSRHIEYWRDIHAALVAAGVDAMPAQIMLDRAACAAWWRIVDASDVMPSSDWRGWTTAQLREQAACLHAVCSYAGESTISRNARRLRRRSDEELRRMDEALAAQTKAQDKRAKRAATRQQAAALQQMIALANLELGTMSPGLRPLIVNDQVSVWRPGCDGKALTAQCKAILVESASAAAAAAAAA